MKKFKFPSINECYEIMSDIMPKHIIEHSEQVMKVAVKIIQNLRNNVNLNKDIIIASCLLHDIYKARSLQTGERHDEKGAEYIRKLGYRKIASIIKEHVNLNFDPAGKLLEKEIVFYADKRVMHTSIVSVEKRIEDVLMRYGKTNRKKREILKTKKLIMEVEKKISSFMTTDINKAIEGR